MTVCPRTVLHERHKSIFQWWPIVAFFTTQLIIAGVIYGDIRARLTAIEVLLKSNTYYTRVEAEAYRRTDEREHAELRRELDILMQNH